MVCKIIDLVILKKEKYLYNNVNHGTTKNLPQEKNSQKLRSKFIILINTTNQ